MHSGSGMLPSRGVSSTGANLERDTRQCSRCLKNLLAAQSNSLPSSHHSCSGPEGKSYCQKHQVNNFCATNAHKLRHTHGEHLRETNLSNCSRIRWTTNLLLHFSPLKIQYLVWSVCAFCVSFMWMFVCASVFLPIFVCLSSGTFHNGLLKIHLKGRGLPDFLYTLYGKHAFLVPYSSHVRKEGNNLPWHHVIGGESKMVCSM